MAAWTDEETATLKRLHADGLSLGAIRKAMARPQSTVSRHASALGLSFDRSQMANAVAAAQVDRKSRRGAIIDRLYGQAEKILGRLEDPEGFDALINIGMGEQGARRLGFVPGIELRALMASASAAVAAAERLEKVDSDGGAGEVRGLVGTLMLNLETVGSAIPPVDEELAADEAAERHARGADE